MPDLIAKHWPRQAIAHACVVASIGCVVILLASAAGCSNSSNTAGTAEYRRNERDQTPENAVVTIPTTTNPATSPERVVAADFAPPIPTSSLSRERDSMSRMSIRVAPRNAPPSTRPKIQPSTRPSSQLNTQRQTQRSTETFSNAPPSTAIMAPPAIAFAPGPQTTAQVTALVPSPATASHLDHLPAGAQHRADKGFATVEVFYATDRERNALPMSSYEVSGKREFFAALAGTSTLLICFGGVGMLLGGTTVRRFSLVTGCAIGCVAAAFVLLGQANIEKHGASYNADRGSLTHGICEVTVPDSHQRGAVERPSLLRLEFREDSQEHIVLTSAVELSQMDFEYRLSKRVASSQQQDLLVFIHGYNVDFDSAVQRTAQISVDLPFSGVPVCYSWPSQGSLLGYAVDENNATWTVTHLKNFLTSLAENSGARSINIVAHSMGNRALADAIRQIDFQQQPESSPMFDRLVLAAPDVDADHFRRDLAPSMLKVAKQVTLYASSDDQALIASKQVHGYPPRWRKRTRNCDCSRN